MKQKSSLMKTAKKVRGKRDWVKNAIIIFLAVLLVLTFFSNTIMNYSLPEVAAQYPLSTTITTKIRGSGTVEAAQTYHVQVQETRTVASLSVKVGDKVEAGQTLLTLDETESTELQEARTAYANLKLEYDKMLLDKGDQNNATAASLQQAKAAVSRAENDLANARQYESNLKSYQSQEASAQQTLIDRTKEKTDAENRVESLRNQVESVKSSNQEYQAALADVAKKKEAYEALNFESGDGKESQAYLDYMAALDEEQRIFNEQILPQTAELEEQILTAEQEALIAKNAESNAQAEYSFAQAATQQYQASYTGATSVESAKSALQSAQDALASLGGDQCRSGGDGAI